MESLLVANVDYVVDILCRGLRHLGVNPTAPLLFVAVLRRTGVAPHLLPLLKEPVSTNAARIYALSGSLGDLP